MKRSKMIISQQDYVKQTRKPYVAPTLTVTDFKVERGYSSSGSGVQAFTMDPFMDFQTMPEGDEASHFGRTVFDWD